MHDEFVRQILQLHAEHEHGHDDKSAADAQKPRQHPGNGAHDKIQSQDFEHVFPLMAAARDTARGRKNW